MNWYKRAQTEDIFDINELLDWISGHPVKLAQIRRGPTAGHRHSKLTPKQEDFIKRRYEQGQPQTGIAKELGLTSGIVRSYLVREGIVSPSASSNISTGRGISDDADFIDDVKKLRRTIDPATGKFYNNFQISKKLDVSSQTIDRTVGRYDPRTPDELSNYVSYKFWDKYPGGIENYIENIPQEKRIDFVTNFIDSLFKDPRNRASAKEGLFKKLKIRNEMLGDPTSPATQLVESPYNPDFAGGEIEDLSHNVEEPHKSGVWRKRQQERKKNPVNVSDQYDPSRIDIILNEYEQMGYRGYQRLARKHGISVPNLRAIIVEKGLPIKPIKPINRSKKPQVPQVQQIPQAQAQVPQAPPKDINRQVGQLIRWYNNQLSLEQRPVEQIDEEYNQRLSLLRVEHGQPVLV